MPRAPDGDWIQRLFATFTVTPFLASSSLSSPRSLTSLNLTTVCTPNQDRGFHCSCLSGYQWNVSTCDSHSACHNSYIFKNCTCLIFSHLHSEYCQLLPPVPGSLSLASASLAPGSTLTLSLFMNHTATSLNWYLKQPGTPAPLILHPGNQASFTTNRDQVVLTVVNVSQDWAGEYVCRFMARSFQWELRQTVTVPLQPRDVVRLPAQLSVSCNSFSGFELKCCIPNTKLTYKASWSSEPRTTGLLSGVSGSRCLSLVVPNCPQGDTEYVCELQSDGLAPVRVPISITVIQDGDITCPQDSLGGNWDVTKAGHQAQIPCPMNRTGMVERNCGAQAVWGPLKSNCIDTGLLVMHRKTQLLLAGQGLPNKEVPRLMRKLPEEVEAVSSPSDLLVLLDIVEMLAHEVINTRIPLTKCTLKNFLVATSKLLDLDSTTLWAPAQAQVPAAGSSFLQAVESVAQRLPPKTDSFHLRLPNVEVQSQLLEPEPNDYSISFSTQPPLWARIQRRALTQLSKEFGNVSITSLVLRKLDQILPMNFGPGLEGSRYDPYSLILSNSITADGQSVNQVEIVMDFGNAEGTAQCVFWDHGLFHNVGGWSTEGCQAKEAQVGTAAQCICLHLTSFSILMSLHDVPDRSSLTLLSQVLLGASVLALLLCLGMYRAVWHVVIRNKVSYFRHAALVNVVFCLLAADICFLGASLLPSSPQSPLCLTVAFLCHFLYLATFFWMLAQALVLAHQLLFVFHQLSKRRVLPLMITLGYLCPLGLAAATLGKYFPQGQYLKKGTCWLDAEGGAQYLFVVPVLTIVGVNAVVLALALLKLTRPTPSEGPRPEERHALMSIFKALLILTPVFGLTWGLGLANLMEEISEVPHYLFVVFNASQGIFILLFGCLMDKKMREALLKRLGCPKVPVSTITLVTSDTSYLEHSN
ncbi:adhesion G-protein coupled receptor F3 [Ornithorhynchus anatinus]|nr:adhesion G-protein coupled receptor F3 [Ornithorhynchus anatinus]